MSHNALYYLLIAPVCSAGVKAELKTNWQRKATEHMWQLLSYLAACNLGPAQLTVLIDGSVADVHTFNIPGEPQCWAAVVKNVQFNNRGHLPDQKSMWLGFLSGLAARLLAASRAA